MKSLIRKILYKLFCLLPIDNKVITFESFSGKKYADNPRAIYEKMKSLKLDYKYKWLMNNTSISDELPKHEVIYKGSIKWLYYTAISKIWIKNTGSYGALPKRSGQIYIQTWHGIPIKKMGHDVKNGSSSDAAELWDIVISPNKYYNRCLNSSLNNKLKYLEVGYPRNDIFFNYNENKINEVKKQVGVDLNKKIILYAPTFRDADLNTSIKLDDDYFKDLPSEYVVLHKAHQFQKTMKSQTDNIIDVSNYSDIAELMLISDILITDYSSVLFDFLNLKRPMIFFAYDLDYYRDVERGFYIDYNTLPGPVVRTPKELTKSVCEIDKYWNKYDKRYNEFIQQYCPYEDGQASQRVVDYIIKLTDGRR